MLYSCCDARGNIYIEDPPLSSFFFVGFTHTQHKQQTERAKILIKQQQPNALFYLDLVYTTPIKQLTLALSFVHICNNFSFELIFGRCTDFDDTNDILDFGVTNRLTRERVRNTETEREKMCVYRNVEKRV